MTRRPVAGAALALVLAIGVGACAEEAEPAMTKATYVEQGNEICADTGAQLDDALEERPPVAGDPGAQAAFIRTEFVPISRRMIDDLRGLGYPPGDEEELDQILDDAEDVLIVVGQDPLASLQPDAPSPFAAVDLRMVDYGLTECGES